MSKNDAVCVCGHAHDAHEHYRRGSDCAVCGAEVCARFRRDRKAAQTTTESATHLSIVQPSGDAEEVAQQAARRRKIG